MWAYADVFVIIAATDKVVELKAAAARSSALVLSKS